MSAVLPGRQVQRWLTKQPLTARASLPPVRHRTPTSQLGLPIAASGAATQVPTNAPGQLGSAGRLALLDALAWCDVRGAGSRILSLPGGLGVTP